MTNLEIKMLEKLLGKFIVNNPRNQSSTYGRKMDEALAKDLLAALPAYRDWSDTETLGDVNYVIDGAYKNKSFIDSNTLAVTKEEASEPSDPTIPYGFKGPDGQDIIGASKESYRG